MRPQRAGHRRPDHVPNHLVVHKPHDLLSLLWNVGLRGNSPRILIFSNLIEEGRGKVKTHVLALENLKTPRLLVFD